jgi:hypothetical protein
MNIDLLGPALRLWGDTPIDIGIAGPDRATTIRPTMAAAGEDGWALVMPNWILLTELLGRLATATREAA